MSRPTRAAGSFVCTEPNIGRPLRGQPDRAPYFSSFSAAGCQCESAAGRGIRARRNSCRERRRISGFLIRQRRDVTVPEAPKCTILLPSPADGRARDEFGRTRCDGAASAHSHAAVHLAPGAHLDGARQDDPATTARPRDERLDGAHGEHRETDGSRANACAAIGDVAIPGIVRPPMRCTATPSAARLRKRTAGVLSRCSTTYATWQSRCACVSPRHLSHIWPRLAHHQGSDGTDSHMRVTLRYDDGRKFDVTTNADGRVLLSREVDGKFLTMEPFGSPLPATHATRVFITRAAENQIELVLHKNNRRAMTKETLPAPEQLQQLWRFASTYGRLSDGQQLMPPAIEFSASREGRSSRSTSFHGSSHCPMQGNEAGIPYAMRDNTPAILA